MKLELGPPVAYPPPPSNKSIAEALKALAEGVRTSGHTGFSISPHVLEELAKRAEEKGV